MNNKVKKYFKRYAIGLSIASLFLFLFVSKVSAGLDLGVEYAAEIGLGTSDLRSTIANVINIALGFLGILAVSIILYGGFVYMTAAGEEEKVTRAKNIITQGAIGLGIILSAFAITAFVFNVLLGGTLGTGNGGPQGGGDGSGGGFNNGGAGGGGGDVLSGCPDPIPNDSSPFICELSGESGYVEDVVTIQGGKFGLTGEVFFVSTKYATDDTTKKLMTEDKLRPLINEASCNDSDKCLKAEVLSCGSVSTWTNNQIVVAVPPVKKDSQYYVVVKTVNSGESNLSLDKDTDKGPGRNDDYTVKDGLPGPGIICLSPDTGKVGEAVSIIGRRFGEVSGVVKFRNILASVTTGNWTNEEIKTTVPAGTYTGKVVVTRDKKKSNGVLYKVSCSFSEPTNTTTECASGCCNTLMCVESKFCNNSCSTDSDCSAGMICGSSGKCEQDLPGPGQSCGEIDGNICSVNTDCRAGNVCNLDSKSPAFCKCDPVPVILDVEPKDGAPGNFVTVYGVNFGEFGVQSKIVFLGDLNDNSDDVVALPPEKCGSATNTWENDSVIIEIPASAKSGPIKIITASGQSDDTNNEDSQGLVMTPLIADENKGFIINDIKRPGLCFLTKSGDASSSAVDEGYFRDGVDFFGINFAAAGQDIKPLIGNTPLNGSFKIATISNYDAITDGQVPNLVPNKSYYDAQVKVGNEYSNPVDFKILNPADLPSISYIEATKGPKGQYVSIVGAGFGSIPGKLTFDPTVGDTIVSSGAGPLFNFPTSCSLASTWTNNNIIFTVPDVADISSENNLVNISVTNSIGLTNPREENAKFTICEKNETDCQLTPGICAIKPNQGPAGTRVQVFGNGFGTYNPESSALIFSETKPVNVSSITDCLNDFGCMSQYWTNVLLGKSLNNDDLEGAFASVPANAVTGPVRVDVASGDDVISTPGVWFEVSDCRKTADLCGQDGRGPVCCKVTGQCMTDSQAAVECKSTSVVPSRINYEYYTGTKTNSPGTPMVVVDSSCDFTTQSPSPFIDSKDACKGAAVSARFVNQAGEPVPMPDDDFADYFNESSVQVFDCGNDEIFDQENCSVSQVSGSFDPLITVNDSFVDGFKFYPDTDYNLNTWYFVRLVSGPNAIRSDEGLWLDGNNDGVTTSGDDFTWSFRTGNDSAACKFDSVQILPNRVIIKEINGAADYSASVLAQNCNILNSNNFDWTWESQNQDGSPDVDIAAVTNNNLIPVNKDGVVIGTFIDPQQTATALDQGVAFIGATAFYNQAEVGLTDFNNKFIVDLDIPEVTNITHDNGFIHPAVDSVITISGKNFGNSKNNSKVFFGNSEAQLAQCVNSWTDNKIQVVAPKPELKIGSGALLRQTSNTSIYSNILEKSGVAYYNFNSSSNVEVVDDFGDSDGVIYTAEKSSEAIEGLSLKLSNGYVEIPSTEFKLTDGSVSLWFKSTKTSSVADETLFNAGDFSIDLGKDNSIIVYTGDNISTYQNSIPRGEWVNLVYTSVDGKGAIYINGRLIEVANGDYENANFTTGLDLENDKFIYIGATKIGDVVSKQFTGLVDLLTITNEGITSSEAKKISGFANDQGILTELNFDNQGNDIIDSGNVKNKFISTNYPLSVEGYSNFGKSFSVDGSSWKYLNDKSSYVYNNGVTLAFWAKDVDLDSLAKTVYTDSYNGGLEFVLGKTGNCGGKDICFKARGYNESGVATDFYAAANRPEGFDESDWHLYIGVLDIENKNISLYIDGGLIDSENDVVANATFELDLDSFEIIYKFPTTGNCIGGDYILSDFIPECGNQNSEDTDSAFVGVLDNLVIYNYVLNDKQIGTLSGVSTESIVHVLTSGGSSIGSADPIFTKSDNIYPFLCNLTPNFGTKGAAINASGVNFGDSFKQLIGNDSYYNGSNIFHDLIILSYEAIRTWANKSVVFANPFDNQPIPYRNVTLQIDPYSEIFKDIGTPVNGLRDGLESYFEINDNTVYDKKIYDGASKLVSNPQKFYFSPVITSLSPDNGPIGQWVTISGYNFGQHLDEYGDIVPGKVYFSGADGLIEALVVTNICINQASWSNKSIIAQVPVGAVSGDVFVETENGVEAGLLSNPSKFDINNKPLGPGISCIDPNHVSRFGGDVSIKGVRFGNTGTDDNVVVDRSSKLGTLNSIWSNNLSLTTRDDLSIGTHEVQIRQRTFVGQECAGFSIGAFCPGGKVDVYEDIFSNSVPLDVSPICEYGLIGKQDSVSLNWPLNTGYSTEYIGVDGGYVYILDNQSIVRFSNGSSGTTLGQTKTYTKDDSSESSISSTKSFFALKGRLYSVSTGNSIQEISLDEKLSTYKVKDIDLTSRSLIDLVWGEESGAEYKVTANSNYMISLGLANSENKSLRFISGGQPRSETYGGYWMRVYNPSNDFALVKDVFISDVKSITDADIASIIAEDDYLYIITKQGVVRVIDLKSNNFFEMDDQLLEWNMGDDGDISGELNGQWDPRTGNIYMGVSSSELQPDKLYRYYGCMAGDGCRTNADCTACGAAVSSCVNGTCTPVITKVTPPKAAVGDYVTIKGCYLGNDKSVCFTKTGATSDAICGAGFILGKRVAPICGVTSDSKIVVVEVPNLDANNNQEDDAETGPVKVVVRGIDRDQNAYTRTAQTFDTTSVTPTPLERSSSSPYYSFGVKDFIVDNSIIQPTVCGLTPNEGLAGSNVQVNGEGFGNELTPNFDKVMFKGDSSTEADNVEGENFIKCSGEASSWSSTKICLQVPLEAVTGAVEVTNEKIESANEIEYEVYSVTDGPVVRATNPSKNSASVCTNSLIEIQFTTEVDPTTLDGNIFLKECSNSAPFAKKGRMARFISAIKELVLHKGSAQVSNSALTCNVNVPIKNINSRSYEGGSLVTVTPDGILSSQTLHRVDIGEGIRSLDGVLINQRRVENNTKDSSPLANRKFVLLEAVDNDDTLLKFVNTGLAVGDIIRTSSYEFMRVNAISGNDVTVVRGYFGTPLAIAKDSNLVLEDEFTFATKGSKNLVNSGICKFDDIEVSVYSDSNSNGVVSQKDSFMCTGDKCRLVFDYDQAPGPRNDGPSEYDANNQHKYVARATSEINDTTSYTDRFERATLITNDTQFITEGGCPISDFEINNGSLKKSGNCSVADSLIIATKDSKNNIVPKIFPRLTSAKVEATILSSTPKSGLLINGNTVSREIIVGPGVRDYQYVIQGSSGRWVSSKIPLAVGEVLPSNSRWEVEMINGRVSLKVDGLQVIPDKNPVNSNPNVIFSNSGKYGFYTYSGLSMLWDDYKLTLEEYNVLQGNYTWSRSDLTDPKRLITIRPNIISGQVQDLLPTDQDKIKSTSGIIYSEVSPESLGQAKIVIEATTDAGEESNTVSKEFPINIFLCSNPWPDFNAQFTDNAFNFLTYYCRDIGSAENIQDTLPDASIVQKCEYKSGDTNWNTAQCLNFKNGGYVCNQDNICAK